MINRNKYEATIGGVRNCVTVLFNTVYLDYLKGSNYGNKAIK